MPQTELTQDAFESHVEEHVKSLQEKPRRLGTLLLRWRAEILTARFDFDHVATQVAELRTVTRDAFVEFVDSHVLQAAGRRLSVGVVGAKERERGASGGAQEPSNGVNGHASGAESDTEPTNGVCAANGAASSGVIEVAPSEVAAFRGRQPLWPLVRATWT